MWRLERKLRLSYKVKDGLDENKKIRHCISLYQILFEFSMKEISNLPNEWIVKGLNMTGCWRGGVEGLKKWVQG